MHISRKQFISALYPSIIGLIFVLLAALFVGTVRLLTINIAVIFKDVDVKAEELVTISLKDYSLIAKKLRLSAQSAQSKIVEQTEFVSDEQSVSSTESATSSVAASQPVAELDLKQFSVGVLNGTTKAGLAGDMKKNLETAGFVVSSVGNGSAASDLVTIRLKQGVPATFEDALKKALEQRYIVGEVLQSPESERYDATIIIGPKGLK